MLEVLHIHKTYENKPLLTNLSLSVQAGEIVCLLGASGSGKSTLLRMVAGVEQPDRGDIRWDGVSILLVPIHQRHFGLMFQDYALFPHLNVRDNVAFGLKMQHHDAKEIRGRVMEALGQVGMAALAEREITDLSGGEQQRVALARTLATRPRLLMLDEPLAALDRSLRQQLLSEIRAILSNTGIPAIYVTHDQEEAYMIADWVMLLGEGRILQAGTPEEVYHRPNSLAVASFLGLKNIVPGTILQSSPDWKVTTELGTMCFLLPPGDNEKFQVGDRVVVLIRQVEISHKEVDQKEHTFMAQVEQAFFQENGYLVHIRAGSIRMVFHLPDYEPDTSQLSLSIPAGAIQVFKG